MKNDDTFLYKTTCYLSVKYKVKNVKLKLYTQMEWDLLLSEMSLPTLNKVNRDRLNYKYIETGRTSDIRLKEHKHVFKTDTLNSKIFVHALQTDHTLNFANANAIKSKCNSYRSRMFLEGGGGGGGGEGCIRSWKTHL